MFATPIFSLRSRQCQSRTDLSKAGEYYYLDTVDWVNVIALTAQQEVVLIEQFRHGIGQVTLEIPGGMVDRGEDPLAAAVRELQEETGYQGKRTRLIGRVTSNPAMINNHTHTALVEDANLATGQDLDGNEEIAVRLVPLKDVANLVQTGIIHHSLVVAAFYHLSLLWQGHDRP